jgi:hypothetical protein
MPASNWLAAVRIISVLYSALVGALFPELLPCLLDLFLRSVRPYFRKGVSFLFCIFLTLPIIYLRQKTAIIFEMLHF